MKQEIIDKVEPCLRETYGEAPLFPCFRRGIGYLHDCKELALRRELDPTYVLAYIPTRTQNVFLRNFIHLSNLFGIPVKYETFQVKNKNFLSIGGWWAKNKFRRELCRLILKCCARPYVSIDDFLSNSKYKVYFLASPKSKQFFLNLKVNTEKQSGFRVREAPYIGFFTWMQRGLIKF